MRTYLLELIKPNVARLLKDDHPSAAFPFDGASIHHDVEEYPAKMTICKRDNETWNKGLSTTRIVNNPIELYVAKLDYIKGSFAK